MSNHFAAGCLCYTTLRLSVYVLTFCGRLSMSNHFSAASLYPTTFRLSLYAQPFFISTHFLGPFLCPTNSRLTPNTFRLHVYVQIFYGCFSNSYNLLAACLCSSNLKFPVYDQPICCCQQLSGDLFMFKNFASDCLSLFSCSLSMFNHFSADCLYPTTYWLSGYVQSVCICLWPPIF